MTGAANRTEHPQQYPACLGPGRLEEEVDRVARHCARNTARYYADVVGHAPHGRQDVFTRTIWSIEGLDHIRDAQAAGHGVVLASAHYANPEFALQGIRRGRHESLRAG